MSDPSRRSLLVGVPAAAVTMATPVAGVAVVAVAAGSDSVLAVVEAHRAAWDRFSATDDPSDTIYGRQNGIIYTDADHAAFDEVNNAETAAWEKLLSAPCRSLSDAQQKATYLLGCKRWPGVALDEDEIGLLLQSFAGGEHV